MTVVILSGIFADVVPTNRGADANGFEEYVDSSRSAAMREDSGEDDDASSDDMSFLFS